jgi:tRNA(adenine34) deaminase
MTDNDYMDLALRYAMEAFARGDWPVGSVIVRDGEVLGSGQNRQNSGGDVTTHGELEAIRRAIGTHGAERVTGATLYTTMEPCPMCACDAPSYGHGNLQHRNALRARGLQARDN